MQGLRLIFVCFALVLALAQSLRASEPVAADSARTAFRGSYELEVLATVSSRTGHTPFWLITNRAGLGSPRPGTGFGRGAFHASGNFASRWSWYAGTDLVGAWRTDKPFLIRELYGAVRYRDFELSVGSRLEDDRLVDQRLSSGDLLFSGNAVPIPQVKLFMPDYLSIPGTRKWLGFKVFAALGRFTDDNWQEDFVRPGYGYRRGVYYHSKGLRVRIGRPDVFPVTFEGGLEMAAQFAGGYYVDGELRRKYPSGFKNLLHILIPSGGGGQDFPGEQSNVLGNHVGEWSARLRWDAPAGFKLSAYYLHYFEDHSMMTFDFVWRDGLYGLELAMPRNPFVSKFVYEYLTTKDQSGPVYWDHTSDIPEQVSGIDNYYNHGMYGGWQHWGMGIGNPLILSPAWTGNGTIVFRCNRIQSHHFGAEGEPLTGLRWRVLATVSCGWGTYSTPFREVLHNGNVLVELTYEPRFLKGWSVTGAAAIDRGGMLGVSNGLLLSIKKTGIL